MGSQEISIPGDMISTTQISTVSTNVHSQKRDNLKLTQSILLVWLDNNVDDSLTLSGREVTIVTTDCF